MHPEAITSKQKEVLKRLSVPAQFYMAGGTALALQIGHRMSVDFDFFATQELPPDLLNGVEKSAENAEVIVREAHQLTVRINAVEVTYLHYPFPPILPFAEYETVKLLSIKEVAASKAHTIGRRATMRDYVDLYCVFAWKYSSLAETIGLAQRKYGGSFDPRLFLEQLVYFEDIPEAATTFLKEQITRKQMEEFFAQQIKKILL